MQTAVIDLTADDDSAGAQSGLALIDLTEPMGEASSRSTFCPGETILVTDNDPIYLSSALSSFHMKKPDDIAGGLPEVDEPTSVGEEKQWTSYERITGRKPVRFLRSTAIYPPAPEAQGSLITQGTTTDSLYRALAEHSVNSANLPPSTALSDQSVAEDDEVCIVTQPAADDDVIIIEPDSETSADDMFTDDRTAVPRDPDHSPFFCPICERTVHNMPVELHNESITHQLAKADREYQGQPAEGNQVSNRRRGVYALNEDNIGFKLLRGAGWTPDTGLGAEEQGRLAPIRASMKQDRLGLGIRTKRSRSEEEVQQLKRAKAARKEAERDTKERARILAYLKEMG
ncbi:hypothetical protein BC832DRAFT_593285 [Gaertneriomyces semiglobifer]|nr:hypothetical protein BC832DRAFT_593285 [Gaertneriomyces semiglobifer]